MKRLISTRSRKVIVGSVVLLLLAASAAFATVASAAPPGSCNAECVQNNRLTALENQNAAQASQITNLQDRVSVLEDRLSAAENAIAGHNAEIAALEGRLHACFQNGEVAVGQYDGYVGTHQTALDLADGNTIGYLLSPLAVCE
jgi:uncharacterized coiled-coil protein SlyX